VWPHSITVGIEGQAIAVGTDDPEAIAGLGPWRVEDVGGTVDYHLELHPEESGRGTPKRLPGLYHGSCTLLRTRDADRLRAALLRVLASHARPAHDGQFRVALMPLVRQGVALLAPPAAIGSVSDRWLVDQGIEAFHTVSSLVDVASGQVLVDPPLGSTDAPLAPTFGGWWLPASPRDGALSPGFAVAKVMSLVIDVTEANVASTLPGVAMLVQRAQPVLAPRDAHAIQAALLRTVGEFAAP
jgi:hypothetical protein